MLGATHYTDSAFLDPGLFLRGLAAAARAHGATIRPNSPVAALVRDGDIVSPRLTLEGLRIIHELNQ